MKKKTFIITTVILSCLLIISFIFNLINIISKNNTNETNTDYIFTYNGSTININKYVYRQSLVIEIGNGKEEVAIIADALGNVNKVNGTIDLTRNKTYKFKESKQLLKITSNILDNGNTIRYIDTTYIYLTKKETVTKDEKCFYFINSKNEKTHIWETESQNGIKFTIYLN